MNKTQAGFFVGFLYGYPLWTITGCYKLTQGYKKGTTP
jgi:hypothetical protein